jgi:hypothetical protein
MNKESRSYRKLASIADVNKTLPYRCFKRKLFNCKGKSIGASEY